MATVRNIVIDQGTTFTLSITVSDFTDTPINLTGYTLRSQMRKSYNSNTYTAFTVTSDEPTEGEINLSLTATQTSALRYGRYVYDVEIVSSTGVVTRVLEGIVTVNPEVTK
jgi:hypothetical protein